MHWQVGDLDGHSPQVLMWSLVLRTEYCQSSLCNATSRNPPEEETAFCLILFVAVRHVCSPRKCNLSQMGLSWAVARTVTFAFLVSSDTPHSPRYCRCFRWMLSTDSGVVALVSTRACTCQLGTCLAATCHPANRGLPLQMILLVACPLLANLCLPHTDAA